VPCSFPLTSGEGASFCFLALPALLAIIGAVLGCCLCACLGFWGRRHYQRRKAAQELDYLEQTHANSLRTSVLGHHGNFSEMGFYDDNDGDDDDQFVHANGGPGGRHEGEDAAMSASAARTTAEQKKLALQKRMLELEDGADQIFRLKAEAKQKAEEEARQMALAAKPKRTVSVCVCVCACAVYGVWDATLGRCIVMHVRSVSCAPVRSQRARSHRHQAHAARLSVDVETAPREKARRLRALRRMRAPSPTTSPTDLVRTRRRARCDRSC
jgi:hypothetical protein